jgi:hypothetical protein
MNTRPAARTAWLYVGGGEGALGVRMISFAISLSNADWTTDAPSNAHLKHEKRLKAKPERFQMDIVSQKVIAGNLISQLQL